MPILDLEEQDLDFIQKGIQEPEMQYAVSWGQALQSAFRAESTITALGNQLSNFLPEPNADLDDPNFDPFTGLEETHYAEYARAFFGAKNPSDVANIKAKIDRQLEDRRILEKSGARGFISAMAAGVFSPEVLLPVFQVSRAFNLARSAVPTTTRIGTLDVAVNAGASAAASEFVLHQDQEMRTFDETMMNVGAATLLGAALGKAIVHFSGSPDEIFAKAISPSVERTMDLNDDIINASSGGHGGAAFSQRFSKYEGELVSALGIEKAIAKTSPLMRVPTYGDETALNLVLEMAETPFMYKGNQEGIATTRIGAIETLGKVADAHVLNVESQVDELFVQYRKGRASQFGDVTAIRASDIMGTKQGELNFEQFWEEIGNANSNGDKHHIPEVEAAAKLYRTEVFDKYAKRAIDAGLFPEDILEQAPLGQVSYFMRMLDAEKIAAKRSSADGKGFVDIITSHLVKKGNDEKLTEQLDKANKRVEEQTSLVDYLRGKREAEEAGKETKAEQNLKDLELTKKVRESNKVLSGEIKKLGKLNSRLSTLGKQLSEVERKLVSENLENKIKPSRKRALENRAFELDQEVKKTELDIIDAETKVKRAREDLKAQDVPVEEGELATFFKFLKRKSRPTTKQGTSEYQAYIAAFKIKKALRENNIDLTTMRTKDIIETLKSIPESKEFDEMLSLEINGKPLRKLIEGKRLEKGLKKNRKVRVKDIKFHEARLQRLEARAETMERMISASDPKIARQIADEIADACLGAPRTKMFDDVVSGPRGPLKERVLDIPDELIAEFLVRDPRRVARFYARTVMIDSEFVRRFGSTNLSTQIGQISDNFARSIVLSMGKIIQRELGDSFPDVARAFQGLSLDDAMKQFAKLKEDGKVPGDKVAKIEKSIERANKKLSNLRDNAIRDIEGIRDRIRGEYDLPQNPHGWAHRTERGLLASNYIRLLGEMAISAIPDLGMPVLRYGVSNVFKGAFNPLFKDAKKYSAALSEMKALGAGIEMASDARASALADVVDDYGAGTKFERGLNTAARTFGMVTLMSPWNATLKQMVGPVFTTWLRGAMDRVASKSASQLDITRLASMGFDDEMIKRVRSQFKQHAADYDTEHLVRLQNWDDAEAAQAFQSALIREVDNTILTPGQDKPFMFSKSGWRLILQFKSFAMAATNRILIAGLQQRDAAFVSGVIMMLGLGGLVYQLKSTIAGRETPAFDEKPEKWISEMADRSGIFGWMSEANAMADKMGVGLNSMLGSGQLSRYQSRNLSGALAGPTAGLVNDVGTTISSIASGEVSQSGTHALRRLIPYQNTFYLKNMFDMVENGINEQLGIFE